MGLCNSNDHKQRKEIAQMDEQQIKKNVDDIFNQHGSPGKDEMTKQQFTRFLKQLATKNDRNFDNKLMEKFYYQTDKDKNGNISKSQLQTLLEKVIKAQQQNQQ